MDKNRLIYFDASEKNAAKKFGDILYERILESNSDNIVVLCVGTDRATGDSFGPLVGHVLTKSNFEGVTVYGTLDNPVHAKNIAETIEHINKFHKDALVIAIDACLGKVEHIGYISLYEGPLIPGSGVNKCLPSVGHITVTGIVNFSGVLDMLILQNTRLNLVIKMADIASKGILKALRKRDKQITYLEVVEA